MSDRRLIEEAFPLVQASIDSVHEKNVRHGHISTLHIWPARRPLAACRAALIATLLPDPGNAEERARLVERIGGKVVHRGTKERGAEKSQKAETVGGVLHWGRENSPDMDWFRQRIREAYGGRAPRVLDPFAGGGAIPLEAMRLGCEVTAADLNPVAWFILKCTLEYPQRLAGKKRRLPDFALESSEFMDQFRKKAGTAAKRTPLQQELIPNRRPVQGTLFGIGPGELEADLAWHVRAWGWWVLQRARADLARFYPTVDGKPTLAYLWARTVPCKGCRAVIPLLKTRWLCKDEGRRAALGMEVNDERTGVNFFIQTDLPKPMGSAAQRREIEKRIGGGTISRSGATCPCCGTILTREDLSLEGRAKRLGMVMTTVAVDGGGRRGYRLPTQEDIKAIADAEKAKDAVFAEMPYGEPCESIYQDAKGNTWCAQYGLDTFASLFTGRQLTAIGTIAKYTRAAGTEIAKHGYSMEWREALESYLACALDRFLDFCNCGTQWKMDRSTVNHYFVRYALPMSWDFAEGNPLSNVAGSYSLCYERIVSALESYRGWWLTPAMPEVVLDSATSDRGTQFDIVLTDPPYYDAISYSAVMDFFYVWLRRTLQGLSPGVDTAFANLLAPKWNHSSNDGELIDDASRFGGDKTRSKAAYEDGMARAFRASHESLTEDGRLVIVFAHKHPDAWETLVSAIIRAGFVVDGSWPIQTEMGNRTRAQASAALSSSVWLVCKKRAATARPGWDNVVLEGMRRIMHGERDPETGHWTIHSRLHQYWDAGIRGPDFVWAATGPALEAYSKHPVVRKANEAGAVMSVSEFLRHVRRLVVEFVVGQVLAPGGGEDQAAGLDDLTTYYLLHRHDFGLEPAPVGACILYAISCNLSDRALVDVYDLLVRAGGGTSAAVDEEDEGSDEEEDAGDTLSASGSEVGLKPWTQRKRRTLGQTVNGRPAPLIDQVHALMHLWKGGDVTKVDGYLSANSLRQNSLFAPLLQALIELSTAGGEERSTLESISNHLAGRGTLVAVQGTLL